MADEPINTPILTSKLHRPRIDKTHVHRLHLLKRLEKNYPQRPLTLVSAPAGYGKSTLIGCWLEASSLPSRWISLDKNDNNLRQFMAYFLAAVNGLFPGAVKRIQSLLNAADLPPVSAMVRALINELDRIEPPFILVLDDYHFMREASIHDLLTEI